MPLEKAQPLLDALYVKALQVANATGEMSEWDAATTIANELNVAYDQIAAKQFADKMYQEEINKLKKEGVELTDNRLEKLREEADYAGAANEKYRAALDILKDAEGFDFGEMFAEAIDPATFMQAFSQLPDEMQSLFTEVFTGLQFEDVEVTLALQIKPMSQQH